MPDVTAIVWSGFPVLSQYAYLVQRCTSEKGNSWRCTRLLPIRVGTAVSAICVSVYVRICNITWQKIKQEPPDLAEKLTLAQSLLAWGYFINRDRYGLVFPFSALTLLVGQQQVHPACKKMVLVCWWWQFDWNFPCLIAPFVTTTSIILSSNKIQNGDILIPAYLACPGKWRLFACVHDVAHWMMSSWLQLNHSKTVLDVCPSLVCILKMQAPVSNRSSANWEHICVFCCYSTWPRSSLVCWPSKSKRKELADTWCIADIDTGTGGQQVRLLQ